MSFIRIDRIYKFNYSFSSLNFANNSNFINNSNNVIIRIEDDDFIEEFPQDHFKWNPEIIADCYENKKLNVLENLLLYFTYRQRDGYNVQSIIDGIIANSQTSKYSKYFCDTYMNDIKKYLVLI